MQVMQAGIWVLVLVVVVVVAVVVVVVVAAVVTEESHGSIKAIRKRRQ